MKIFVINLKNFLMFLLIIRPGYADAKARHLRCNFVWLNINKMHRRCLALASRRAAGGTYIYIKISNIIDVF